MEGAQGLRKRLKPAVEEKEKDIGDMAITEVVGKEEAVPEVMGSEEMELHIAHLLDKIENFTQQVSELLESGKTMFKELSNEFEERLITMHRERVEKWQEEIRELRMLDAMNEETNAVLQNAQFLLQNPQMGS
ncbi:uncharacterized protein LOC116206128 [Punica granatum]|uniref:Uncharacterized protein LOC116206128 n=1 Tax=Punica granatum TaxID=22663 RepID=A0A6P8DN14_PUNGR|nr:uncharacterized protein LOC116206128 [Punica granatum]